MKLKGSIINGLFQFIPGINYTAGDLIIYLSVLYVVLDDYDGKEVPSESSHCIEYIKYHEYSEDNTGSEAIITSGSFFNIIRSYFKGLTGSGELEHITIDSLSTLDKYTQVGAYFCTITESFLNVIPDGNYLLRIYKSNDVILQEFVNYSNGNIIIRVPSTNKFIVIPSSNTAAQEQLFEHLSTLSDRVKTLVDGALKIKEQSFNFQKVPLTKTKDNGVYQINNLEIDSILHIIILDEDPSGDLQYTKEFYLSDGSRIINQILTGEDKINLEFGSNIATITFSNPKYNIISAYTSKGKK